MKLAEILEKMIERKLSDAHFSLPAEIVKYDSAKQMASVQPFLKQRTVDGVDNNLPVINNVPVFMPRASGFFIHIPIKKGDKVTLFFSDYSIDGWLQDGNKSLDTDVRNHSLNDAFAVPMINYWSSPISGVDADDFVITNGSLEAVFKKSGVIEVDGDVKANTISLKHHVHSVSAVGTAVPALVGTPVLYVLAPLGSTGEPS